MGPYVYLPPGFSITELQRKQAMLNASKQQATGKPKGKWTTVPPLGSSGLDYLSDPQKQSHLTTRSPEEPTTLCRYYVPKGW